MSPLARRLNLASRKCQHSYFADSTGSSPK
jgi:hypothetical protein